MPREGVDLHCEPAPPVRVLARRAGDVHLVDGAGEILRLRHDEARAGAQQAFDIFLAERRKVILYEEALAVLKQLSQHYTLGALTNGNADIYKTDAAEYFDFAYLAENVGFSKPHPQMFQVVFDEMGVSPHEVVHVGDDPEHDIRGAREAGMRTVWMNPGGVPWPGGEPADREIINLEELPAAIASINAGDAR